MHALCMEVLTVHDNELCLFWAKVFPLLVLLMSHIWHSSSSHIFKHKDEKQMRNMLRFWHVWAINQIVAIIFPIYIYYLLISGKQKGIFLLIMCICLKVINKPAMCETTLCNFTHLMLKHNAKHYAAQFVSLIFMDFNNS